MPSLTSVEVVYYPLVVIQTMFLPNVFISCLALVLDILTIDASPPHIIFFLADDLGKSFLIFNIWLTHCLFQFVFNDTVSSICKGILVT